MLQLFFIRLYLKFYTSWELLFMKKQFVIEKKSQWNITEFIWDIFYMLDIYRIKENPVYESVHCESLSERESRFVINFFYCLKGLSTFINWIKTKTKLHGL
jgi:hypothetical protein